MTAGVLTRVDTLNSKYGGIYYDCTIKTQDGDRTLMVDPKMQNYKRHWREIIDIKQASVMENYGVVLDNLKELEKKGEIVPGKLDADIKPSFWGTIELDKING